MEARTWLGGLVRREALVHALNDGFALMLVIVLGSMGVVGDHPSRPESLRAAHRKWRRSR